MLRSFNEVLDANLFPRYIDPFESENIKPVGPPDTATLTSAGVRKASGSVVKILGQAKCRRGIEGSGFAYAEGRIMTNAHVVAGVDEPSVVIDGQRRSARVVLFDSKLDVAVLASRGSGLPTLDFDTSGATNQDAADPRLPRERPVRCARGPHP